ncbi:phosphocholine-specific phospholipase C [Amycolatopsis sp. PS_44_ISF1]|uniref:phosphocholine-specific phospholipase C n=1 Tax=Amycolatopsis sp. PS_44_ISF1 TaxID=2974917 RepID=UPI0028E04C61|nr:phospholipase C, phosphocholine-specific [Amycolatopsis sp. PS_44_ISF1]MDT8913624.1 phospholipase C, phosphocholine-specific [Amycolatopsis sp. PS_44_ISF1]
MSSFSRRRFMQAAGAASVLPMLSQSVARAAAVPAARRTGSIEDIEHVVVLMQENRSFDHYFGSLNGVRGFGDPRPATLPGGRSVWHQQDGEETVLPFRPDVDDLGLHFIQDLNHNWKGTHQAWNRGNYDRWIPAKTPTTMAHLQREDIPFHYALADAFTVCDAYHCSLLGETNPNRYYLWSGCVGNLGDGTTPVITNDTPSAGHPWTTYPQRLQEAGVSWKIYQDIGDGLDAAGSWGWIGDKYRGNYGDNALLNFRAYRDAKPGQPLYDRARTGTDVSAGQGFFDELAADVRGGTLPQVSWVVAPEAYTEHPNWPANYGAWYVARVLDALTADPRVWSRTALLITYDENDGFFDHVVPPFPPESDARGKSTVDVTLERYPGSAGYPAGPFGLGVRVPMLVVSPWSTGGFVCSETFDHTSVIQFLERRFGVHEPNITPWRRAVCGDLTSAFDFTRTNTRRTALPGTGQYEPPPEHEQNPEDYVPPQPSVAALPKQECGQRPTRPLRYQPYVDARATGEGAVSLTFSSGDRAGACFLVRSVNRDDGPWTYTTAAATTLTDTWHTAYSGGTYDLEVHGPNGFLRTFRGPGTAVAPEVTARHDPRTGNLRLDLHNPTGAVLTFVLTDGYGRNSGNVRVAAADTVRRTVRLSASAGWYDLSITAEDQPGYLRRLAGHVETGATGRSDPALITH